MSKYSVSDLKQFWQCPQYWYNQSVARKCIAERSTALEFGTIAHKIFDAKLHGLPWQDRIMQDFAAEGFEVSEDVVKLIDLYTSHFHTWEPKPEWEVQFVETELQLQLESCTLVGRPDACVLWNGKYWHLQHKTLSPSTPVEVFASTQRTDWHECAYQRMMEHAGCEPFAGTILNIMRKLSKKSLDAGLSPFETHYLARPTALVDHALADMEYTVALMEEATATAQPIRNRTACGGPFRNHICQYKDVCDGYTTLNDARFVVLEPRYGATVPEVGE